jgi:small-conductance mechanosensitive channel
VQVVEAGDRTNIVVGERYLVSIFDGDARAEQMTSRQRLAEFHRTAIEAAIKRYRHERGGAYLRAQGISSAVAIALTIAALLAARWAFDLALKGVEHRFRRRLDQLEARSYQVISAEQLRSTVSGGVRAIRWLFRFAVVFACLDYVLGLFPWTRPTARYVASLLLDPLRTMADGFVHALPGLVFIAILVVITRYVLRLTSLFFGGIASGRIRPAGFDESWAWPTYRLVRIGIVAFAVVLAYPYIPGSQSDAFKGVSLFLGLLMSLGASSFVANMLAGYALIYRRAFKSGDRIQVGDVIGDVIAIRQQVTQLRTPRNEEVTIPSATMLASDVINYSSLAREHGSPSRPGVRRAASTSIASTCRHGVS